MSGSESPTKVETISEDIQGQSEGTEGASPIAVITTSPLSYQQAPQTVAIPGTIQIVTSGEALQAVPMAQNSSGAVVQYQQQQQVKMLVFIIFVETRFVFICDIWNNQGLLQTLSVTASFSCSNIIIIFYLFRTVNNIFIQLTLERFKYR